MPFFLWTLFSLVIYTSGLVIIVRVTPMLLVRRFDEGLFMALAALDLIGGICAFGAIVITLAIFNGEIPIRVMDFLLLLGIVFVAVLMSRRSLRPLRGAVRGSRYYSASVQVSQVSCVLAGIYCLVLAVAALYYMVLLFR